VVKKAITVTLDKNLVERLRKIWRDYAMKDLKNRKNPRSFSEFVEFIIKKGLEYLAYGG